jgi:hypothetical protein
MLFSCKKCKPLSDYYMIESIDYGCSKSFGESMYKEDNDISLHSSISLALAAFISSTRFSRLPSHLSIAKYVITLG